MDIRNYRVGSLKTSLDKGSPLRQRTLGGKIKPIGKLYEQVLIGKMN